MADVKSVSVRLSAITDDYVSGMKRAGDSTMDMSRVSGVALAALTAGAVAFAKNAADSYVDYGSSIMKLSRVTGESVETMSKLNFAAQQSGVSTDQLSTGMRFLERNMENGNDKFAQLGVTVRDTGGKLRSSHSVLLDTADAIKRMGPSAASTTAAMTLFGRSGANLLPMLLRGRQGLIDLENDAQKYGMVLTQDNVPAIQEAIEAHRQLDAKMQGLKIRIGQEVLPVFTKLTEAAASVPGPLMAWGPPILAGVAGLGLLVTQGVKFAEAGKKIWDASEKLRGSLPNMGSAVGATTVAIGGAIAVYEIWNAAMQNAYEHARQLGDAVDQANQAGTFDQMAERIGKIDTQISGLSDTINDSSAPWDADYRAELEAYQTQLRQSQAAMQKEIDMVDTMSMTTGRSKDSLKSWLEEEKRSGRTYDNVGLALAAYTGHIDQATMSQDDYKKAVEASKKEVEEANKAEKDSIEPQVQFATAQGKVESAKRSATSAQADYMRMVRDAGDVQDNYNESLRKQADADRKVTDAIHAQRDAQQQLDDLLRGPSVDERLNIEQAQISLEEAKRRAAGKTDTDPALERRKNALEVQRAQLSLKDAQDAHGKAVDAARKNLDSANTSVADAQRAQTEAAKGVRTASDALADYTSKVADAQQKAKDATNAIATANVDLDVAARNLEASFNNGNVSMENNAAVLQGWVAQGKITQAQAEQLTQAFKDQKAAAEAAKPPDQSTPPAAGQAEGPGSRPAGAPPAPAGTAPDPNFNPLVASDAAVLAEWHRRHPGGKANISAGGARYDLAHGRASGGPLEEGWTLVGEEGPELVYKSGAHAQVASNPVTRGLLVPHPFTTLPGGAPGGGASGGAPGGGASGGYTHNGNIVIGKATSQTAFDIVWAQRKLALSVGRR